MKKLLLLVPVLFICGCASTPRTQPPSVAPIRQSVTKASKSNEAARKLAKSAATAIQSSEQIASGLAAEATPAEKTQFVKLQVALTDAQKELQQTQDQMTATATTLGDTLIKADTLEKQVDQQTNDLNAVTKKEALDRKQIVADGITIKKQARDVWIYKGGFIVAILLTAAYFLFSAGILTKLVTMALGLAVPWGWIILGAGVLTLPALLFGVLWKLLP